MKNLMVGMMVYGYCSYWRCGDEYHDHRIEAIGFGWVVGRDEDGGISIYIGDPNDLLEYTKKPEED